MDFWSKSTLKMLLLPGGILLAAGAVLLSTRLITLPASAIQFSYYAVFAIGFLLAWRFHSSRVLFVLLSLFLAQRAVDFFSAGRIPSTGPGHIALEAIAVLLPLNFIAFALSQERGFSLPANLPAMALLFLESVFVTVICRPGETTAPAFLHPSFLGRHPWSPMPQLGVLAFVASVTILFARFVLFRKPLESGLLWSLGAAFLFLEYSGVGRIATGYMGTAGLILVSSIIENSYLLAYHDELTGLRGRRAFNDALLHLEKPYVIAAVDIDHFKSFNDTYGHDTGDEVLRLVASRLAGVSGGGQAYRVGGEEFSIVFPGKSAAEVVPHVEQLRKTIAASSFRVRGGEERRRHTQPIHKVERRARNRRAQDRGSDHPGNEHRGNTRRQTSQQGRPRRSASRKPIQDSISEAVRPYAREELAVTVSIGVAEPNGRGATVEQVILAADKALYRAKQAGRNRVETTTPPARSHAARHETA